MKLLKFALVGATAIAIAACGRQDDDRLDENLSQNVQMEELNALADNAAMDANAEMEALGNQQQQLDATPANEAANAAEGVKTEPSDVEDDVQGM